MAFTGCSITGGSTTGATTTHSTEVTTDSSTPPDAERTPRVLLAYFSRAGENYYYGGRIDLKVGNTEVLAETIAGRIGCDVYRIEAADPYSDDYDATVRRNVDEQEADARPEIADKLPTLDGYDVVLLASPIWNVRPPMIMKTFAESLDFTGRTVHPVVTFAVSGIGNAEGDYTESCPGATIAQALAVRGEEVADSGRDIGAWLRETGLTT
jgi:flavodoxin